MSLTDATQTVEPVMARAVGENRRHPARPGHTSANLVPLLRTLATGGDCISSGLAEDARLAALRQLDLLDTAPTEAFDRITRMASQLFDLPIAAVSLTDSDRQWFKSRIGVVHSFLPRHRAPCAQVAETSQCLVIPDLLLDPRYRDSILASTGVRFYAGAPLTTREGYCLGAICVLGPQPRQASDKEIAALHDLAAMVMAQIELQHAFGRVDPLSGLPNQHQFTEDLKDLAKGRPLYESRFVALVDVASPEQLSTLMRVMGPSFLDEVIQETAASIKSAVGPARKVYHVAPTQFALLSPPDIDEQSYVALLASMLSGLHARAGSRFVTTPVIGVAPFALGQCAGGDVLRIANSAVQDAHGAKSKVSVYSSTLDTIHRRRFTLLHDFGAALEAADQLSLVFQPRIDLASRTCMGAEALLRWRHPTLGTISPGEFVPIVEQTSMAKAMTEWVLGTALAELAAWRAAGLDLQVSVNVSAANLLEPDLYARVIQSLEKNALAAGHLELEITESALMGDGEQALAQLGMLAAAGVRLAIDDFGTRYSSLSYLQRLPVQVVKIDQSFMRDLADDERTRSLVSTMILLSHNLGYRVVAEGIESRQVLDFVAEAACDEVQGYFFGRPMSSGDFTTWMRDRSDPQPCHGASMAKWPGQQTTPALDNWPTRAA